MANRQQVNTLPLRTISDFKSKLKGGGARPNLFEVELTFPSIVGVQDENEVIENSRFLVKAAALPASTVAPIDIPFRGRTLKVAGDRSFESWTVTIINDESFNHRRAFEAWMQNIAQYENHAGMNDPNDYMGQATVYQLGRNASQQQGATQGSGGTANIIAQYRFVDIFPTSVGQIDLSYETTDIIEDFPVEFQIQYYYPEKPGTNA